MAVEHGEGRLPEVPQRIALLLQGLRPLLLALLLLLEALHELATPLGDGAIRAALADGLARQRLLLDPLRWLHLGDAAGSNPLVPKGIGSRDTFHLVLLEHLHDEGGGFGG